MKSKENTPYEK
jgi:hypothetical protein